MASSQPHVTVLLALYDGCEHLEEQLQSYLDQSLCPARVLASDDRPHDGTGAVFQHFGTKVSVPVYWDLIEGPQQGLTSNFLHLLAAVDPAETEYVALSDQDDIWLPEKLRSAVDQITPHGDQPVLLGTRSWEWTPSTGQKVLSRSIPPPLNFAHALVQNYAGGNTMVLNRSALKLVQAALPGMPQPALHDWWLYQLISGAGGVVFLDPKPRLLYRQHTGNQLGANATSHSKLRRLGQMLTGTYRHWMDHNINTLQSHANLLTPNNKALLTRLAQERNAPLVTRLNMLADTGLHRKGRSNQAALWIAAALRRL
ncbi:glycosyl transferase family 2 (plasmid) [Tritonibacter scottomollicae]|uniref:Glycosyl transferase family 2 n=1 Tax=Tritonibacter scottomollicae TaxID=483013 RepID=A0ABZ0HKI2_TRISK|nr:glycosyltransferase [Tritonibacter scottomollicae]WOI35338.1 glycosyl transferase family 2 [Tritonibacter scottomollicae]